MAKLQYEPMEFEMFHFQTVDVIRSSECGIHGCEPTDEDCVGQD